jgi:dTDP-4-dehydrorhamnose reductase
MKVLVTGSDGQLARALAERSAISGIELITVGRPELDLAVPGSARRVIRAAAPDVVINAAAYTAVDEAETNPDVAFRINAEGAGKVAAAAADAGAAVIQISTDYVFDGRKSDPYREEDPTAPLGAYGASKLAGEEAVRDANARAVVVRTAWVHSPFGRNFVKTMMAAAKTRDTLTVVDDQRSSPTSALDLADGLLSLIEQWRQSPGAGEGQTYHLAGSGSTSWCGFARAIMDECRNRALPFAEVQPIATADWPTAAPRPANSVLSSEKFARDFGFVMPDWRSSLGEIVGRVASTR